MKGLRRGGLSILFLLSCRLLAQPLDWDEDQIIFGMDADEQHPALTATMNGTLRAFCISDGTTPHHRVSRDHGISWSSFGTFPSSYEGKLTACSDDDNSYALIRAPQLQTLSLYTFADSSLNWESISVREYDDPMPTLESLTAVSDHGFDPVDSYVSIGWLERNESSGQVAGWFSQSRDHGATIVSPIQVFSFEDNSPQPNSVSIAVSWSGDQETIWYGAAVDRVGSVGEAVYLYRSVDQGENWSEPIALDSSSYPQLFLTLAAHETVLISAYARRVNAASQREIFFTFSLDGGSSFTEPEPVTGSALDDYAPKLVIRPESGSFAIFYLTGDVLQAEATLWMRQGELSSPWLLGPSVQISEFQAAGRAKGFDAVSTPDGFAAVWSGPGPLGDDDIWFDASWQGEPTDEILLTGVRSYELGTPYPNPFNSVIILPLEVRLNATVNVEISNLLGQRVGVINYGDLGSGTHELKVDFRGLPSGPYWLQASSGWQSKRVYLLK